MLDRTIASLATACALVAGAAIPVSAQQTTPIGVSYQPALYWSLPYYIASEKGWWKEVGLEPQFSTFPSGAPQMAAAGSKSVGRRGHRLGAGDPRRPALRHPDHRHHQ